MKNGVLVAVFLAVILTGCMKEKTVDATNEHTFEQSVKEIGDGLDEDKKVVFEESVKILIFSEIQDKGGFFAFASKDTDEVAKDLSKHLDGKTADEIIRLAAKTRKNLKKKQLETIEQEMRELVEKKKASRKSPMILTKIEIRDPDFYWDEINYMQRPTIDFSIVNNTNIVIHRGIFHGVVSSPGRAIPWISKDFSYKFKGGIKPGESKHLKFTPNLVSDWTVQETKTRRDLVMEIDVRNVFGADKESLVVNFSNGDSRRLGMLLKEKTRIMVELKN